MIAKPLKTESLNDKIKHSKCFLLKTNQGLVVWHNSIHLFSVEMFPASLNVLSEYTLELG
jgi:hypothetical protein